MKISELLLQYKTDKNYGVIDRDKGHFYGKPYDEVFNWFDQNLYLNILEIGVQKGGSLKAWKDYFPNASITGVDIVDVREKEYISQDIKFIQSDIKSLNIDECFKKSGLDIIIDDGSHFIEDVIFVVKNYLKVLNTNGVLIIEDVQEPEKWYIDVLSIVKTEEGCFEVFYRDIRKIGHYDDFLLIIKRKNYSGIISKYIKIKNSIIFKHFRIKDLTAGEILKKVYNKVFGMVK